jgi:hypothetical protein
LLEAKRAGATGFVYEQQDGTKIETRFVEPDQKVADDVDNWIAKHAN